MTMGRPRTMHLPAGPPWWEEVCGGFLANLARKGRRPNTTKAYLFELRAFGRWLELVGITQSSQLTGAHLDRFQDWRAVKVVPKTQQVSAAAVRGAFRWASVQSPPLVDATLWMRLTTPRCPARQPRPIPRTDLERIRTVYDVRPDDLVRLGRRALFHVLFSSGARITEALSLDREQLTGGRTATVVQKGGREKLLVISVIAARAVADYLEARRDDCVALFADHTEGRRWLSFAAGQVPPPARLRIKGAQRGWDELCVEFDIKRFTNHQIRHSCATEMIRLTKNVVLVAKHMGHRGLASIDGYAEVGLDEREEMLKGFDAQTLTASPNDAAQLSDAEILQLLALARKSGLAAAFEAATKAGQQLAAVGF
jgi:integrase/recombinase XerD